MEAPTCSILISAAGTRSFLKHCSACRCWPSRQQGMGLSAGLRRPVSCGSSALACSSILSPRHHMPTDPTGLTKSQFGKQIPRIIRLFGPLLLRIGKSICQNLGGEAAKHATACLYAARGSRAAREPTARATRPINIIVHVEGSGIAELLPIPELVKIV